MARSPFKTLTVLLVDEDRFMGKIINSVPHAFEFGSIHTAYEMEEGIILFDQLEKIDLIITDWMDEREGGEDGSGFVKHVRASNNEDNKKAPIVLCTGLTDVNHVFAMRDNGINEVVVKPVAPKQLLDKISNALFKERAFVDEGTYTGPDRRRQVIEHFGGPDRRGNRGMRTDEIDKVMDESRSDPEGES